MTRRVVLSATALFVASAIAASRAAVVPTPRPASPGGAFPGAPAAAGALAEETRARLALRRAEQDHGADSLEAAGALTTLAAALRGRDSSELSEARALAERAVRIRERALGPRHPEVAAALNEYAELLWSYEQFAEARKAAERALQIQTSRLGPEHVDTAKSLYQLASLDRAFGSYTTALDRYERALAIWERAYGADDIHVSNALHYLGALRIDMGDYEAARPLIERSLRIRLKRLGPEAPLTAVSFNTLGNVFAATGLRHQAAAMFERAQAIWEQALGPDHPDVARALANRAMLLSEAGEHVHALRLLERALETRRRAFGPHHHLVARTLDHLAQVLSDAGDDDGAERLLRQALAIQESLQDPGPEFARALGLIAKLHLRRGGRGAALEASLRAEAMTREDFLRSSRGLEEADALQYEATRLSGLDVALSVIGEGTIAAAVGRCRDELVRSRGMVLDRMAMRHRAAADPEPRGLQDVAAALPARSALVAFVRYQRLAPRDLSHGVASYMAFVMPPDGGAPAAIPIGPAGPIDEAVTAWRKQVSSDPRLRTPPGNEREYVTSARRLREAVWDPLAPAIAGARRVFIVPDGAINLVSFATLPTDDCAYLVERGPLLHYLSAERDLIGAPDPPPAGRGLLAIGGADFDALVPPEGLERRPYRSRPPSCPAFRALSFDPAPATRDEVTEIASLARGGPAALTLTGAAAGEGAFKRLAPGRRVIHMATHGYFLTDRCASRLGAPRDSHRWPHAGDNPLLLSGFALAGANRRGVMDDDAEDGMLSAEEIASIDLTGVAWAVLSGCETGMGKVLEGEGVLGLRRAFQIAGARTLIMSLWPVEDEATRLWMRALYAGRLTGVTTIEAVNDASRRLLGQQRQRGGSTHPYYWGGFVAAGDWR